MTSKITTTAAPLALTLADLLETEQLAKRLAGFVLKASAVADRSEYLPCADRWASRERLARLDDAMFAGQRALQQLAV